MKIYKALQMGDYHLNYCEDYLFYGNVGSNKFLCAVMDGCTMGTDSHFISTMVGKLLRKIVKEQDYKEMYGMNKDIENLDDYLKLILRDLFKEINMAKNQLMLEDKEMLTTLIILLLDKNENKGVILTIGDGLVGINANFKEFDQDNKPDYLGFHLNEDFDNWYKNQEQKIFFEDFKDLSIATDGIFSFSEVSSKRSEEKINPIEFLLMDRNLEENEEMLDVKLKKLEYSFGLKPTDDLAIIRLIK